MSTTTPPTHPTWARVVKGQPPPSVPPSPYTPPAARLLQLYKDCVARGTWARLCFETKGGEEELSLSCRVGASTSRTATEAAKKQGAKRPANERRRERARRRRKAWEEKRRLPAASGSAAGGGAAIIAQTGEASQPGTVTAIRSNSHWQEQQLGQEQQQRQPAGVAAVGISGSLGRSSSRQQEKQPSEEAAAIKRSGSRSRSRSSKQEQLLSTEAAEAGAVQVVASSATSVDAAAVATAAIREKTKVAVLERRAGARALALARRRGSEVSDGLRSPEPAMPELEISWVSEAREELEEEECGKKPELELEPPLPEPNEEEREQEYPLPRQQGFTCSCCLSRNHDTAYPVCSCCGYKVF
jgi:hypothetical protein